MDWDTFERAIASLKDWPRFIGIMGGEPTLHPEFERFVKHARNSRPEHYNVGGGHKPTASLSRYIEDVISVKSAMVNKHHGLGLWSSVCATYTKHYETIQDNFIYQCVNDHTASSRHQAWLLTRKEYGVSDSEWVKIRDNCWWHRTLNSPSITPKGAFFCEVAAAMDILYDGPGGWKLEKDWWKKDASDYKDQLMWCEYCSGAFCDLDRDANEERDDISPFHMKKLEELGSPKIKQGRFVLHKPDDGSVRLYARQEKLMYQDDSELRVTDVNQHIYISDVAAISGENIGHRIIPLMQGSHWVVYSVSENSVSGELYKKIQAVVYNPGTLHYFKEFDVWMFNSCAHSLNKAGIDGISRISSIAELRDLWIPEKVVSLSPGFEMVINPDLDEWREYIKTNGLMKFYNLRDSYATVEYRTTVFEQLKQIERSETPVLEKLKMMSNIAIGDVVSSALTSKYKTAIHNCIAKELAVSSYNYGKLIDTLKQTGDDFCVQYALAMLTFGIDKQEHFCKCILDENNRMGLGICALLDDVDSKDCNKSIIEELHDALSGDTILLGYRYSGMSVHMIASGMNLLPLGFADDERHGHAFGGTLVYSIPDMYNKFPAAKIVVCVPENQLTNIAPLFAVTDNSREIIRLSNAALKEMSANAHIDNTVIEKLKSMSFSNVAETVKFLRE
jgi:hypothetical protein